MNNREQRPMYGSKNPEQETYANLTNTNQPNDTYKSPVPERLRSLLSRSLEEQAKQSIQFGDSVGYEDLQALPSESTQPPATEKKGRRIAYPAVLLVASLLALDAGIKSSNNEATKSYTLELVNKNTDIFNSKLVENTRRDNYYNRDREIAGKILTGIGATAGALSAISLGLGISRKKEE